MTPFVGLVVLCAAVVHASWNAIAHRIEDELACNVLVGLGRVGCGIVLACLTPFPAPGVWPYLAVSTVVHILYQVLLMRSFRLGDFGQVYPIARGTAPLVVAAVAAGVLGERLRLTDLAGIAVASPGLLGLALWGIRERRQLARTASAPKPRIGLATAAAVATGLTIAGYTILDGAGVRASATVLSYVAWLMILDGAPIPAYAIVAHGRSLVERLRPVAALGLLGGLLSVVAYGLVLWAQDNAPLAPVAVLRESSIVVGAAIATVVFKERFGAMRIAASVVLLTGVGLTLWP